jgi:hypothetical protein
MRSSTAMPAAQLCATSAGRSASPGCGARGAASSASAHLAGELHHALPVGRGHLDGARLKHHEAHPVPDRVVHLPGDPGALGEHGLAGQQFALALGPLGALAQRGQQQGAGAHVDADGPGEDDQDDAAQPAAHLIARVAARPRLGHHDHPGDRRGEPQWPAADVPAHRVGQQQQEAVQRRGHHRQGGAEQERHQGRPPAQGRLEDEADRGQDGEDPDRHQTAVAGRAAGPDGDRAEQGQSQLQPDPAHAEARPDARPEPHARSV